MERFNLYEATTHINDGEFEQIKKIYPVRSKKEAADCMMTHLNIYLGTRRFLISEAKKNLEINKIEFEGFKITVECLEGKVNS